MSWETAAVKQSSAKPLVHSLRLRSPKQFRTRFVGKETSPLGNLLSSWNQSLVITFDDVLLNTELRTYDVVDAQTREVRSRLLCLRITFLLLVTNSRLVTELTK